MKINTREGFFTSSIKIYEDCIENFPVLFTSIDVMQNLYLKYKASSFLKKFIGKCIFNQGHITKIKDDLEASLMRQCIEFNPIIYEFTVLG